MTQVLLLAALTLAQGRSAPPVEVLEPQVVAPGLLYAQRNKDKVIIHVLKLDLKARDLHLRSVKARGKETIRQIVERMNDEETLVLGAINGDFFRQETSQGLPYGVQVSDGRLIFAPMRRSMIGFGPTNEPYIGVVSLKARIAFGPKAKRPPAAKWLEIAGINTLEDEGIGTGIYLYTPAFLGLSLRRPDGLVAVVDSIEPALQVGDVCEGKVSRVETSDKRVKVPESGCILYFLGPASRQLQAQVTAGEEVALKLELPPIVGGVSQAIGGGPRLIKDGKQMTGQRSNDNFESFHWSEISARHPRSAIGFDQKKQNLFLVMVEGRHEGSQGMTFTELSKFLASLGCYQAMGFDGGGSAGMYVAGKGFVSRSMGGFGQYEERAVANGLLITSPKTSGKRPAGEPIGKAPAREGPKGSAPSESPQDPSRP